MRKLPVWIEKKGGLDFACTRCGDCCGGAPGYVWVSEAEVARLAEHLGLERNVFGVRYLRRVGADLSLVEKAGGDCVFFERGKGCSVYAARPTQCRTYPFWPEVVATAARWQEEAARCPGVRGGGRIYTADEVRAFLSGEGSTSGA